jgi:hypothetical protein
LLIISDVFIICSLEDDNYSKLESIWEEVVIFQDSVLAFKSRNEEKHKNSLSQDKNVKIAPVLN